MRGNSIKAYASQNILWSLNLLSQQTHSRISHIFSIIPLAFNNISPSSHGRQSSQVERNCLLSEWRNANTASTATRGAFVIRAQNVSSIRAASGVSNGGWRQILIIRFTSFVTDLRCWGKVSVVDRRLTAVVLNRTHNRHGGHNGRILRHRSGSDH